MNNLSVNLKHIRKDNNLSQEQLADILSVSRQAISKWESGIAYPEMDKIVYICQRFDVNIDDLLNKDIREVNREKQSKNNINKYIDDFLNFISDTISLFMNMSFKTLIKCILEQIIIICMLILLFAIIGNIGSNILNQFYFDFIPIRIFNFIHGLISGLYYIFIIVLGTIIIVHLFKTRYLNYYNKIKLDTSVNDDQTKEKNNFDKENIDSSNKIVYKNNENKIIIRDPKHSEYRFINGIFKIIVCFTKAFILFLSLGICMLLVGIVGCGIFSFKLIKAKLLFLGLLISSISFSCGLIVILLLFLNFIFNRTNDKKKMIWSFIISIISFGIGVGLLFISSLNFEVINSNNYNKTVFETINMADNLVIRHWDIDYIEKDIPNIEIECKLFKIINLDYYIYEDNQYQFVDFRFEYPTRYEEYKISIEELSNYKLINFNNTREKIVVYASKENIEKLKNNYKDVYKE